MVDYITIIINDKEKIEYKLPGCGCCNFCGRFYNIVEEYYPEFKNKKYFLYLNNEIINDNSSIYDSGIKGGSELVLKLVDTENKDESVFYINLIINENDKFKIGIDESKSVLNFKEKINSLIGLNVKNMELLFEDKILDDDKLIENCNIKENDEIRLKIII